VAVPPVLGEPPVLRAGIAKDPPAALTAGG
jgi:hypothetical protein